MKCIVIYFLLVSTTIAAAMDSVENPVACKLCGMDRTAFAHSRILIHYVDGSSVGTCSLHCAAENLQNNKHKQISSIMVADYSTKELLVAKTASWVVGGKMVGVMTDMAKWAFASPEHARRFVEDHGGVISTFEQAMNSATIEILAQHAEEKAVESEMLRELK